MGHYSGLGEGGVRCRGGSRYPMVYSLVHSPISLGLSQAYSRQHSLGLIRTFTSFNLDANSLLKEPSRGLNFWEVGGSNTKHTILPDWGLGRQEPWKGQGFGWAGVGLRSGPDMLYLLSLSRPLCSQLPNRDDSSTYILYCIAPMRKRGKRP